MEIARQKKRSILFLHVIFYISIAVYENCGTKIDTSGIMMNIFLYIENNFRGKKYDVLENETLHTKMFSTLLLIDMKIVRQK